MTSKKKVIVRYMSIHPDASNEVITHEVKEITKMVRQGYRVKNCYVFKDSSDINGRPIPDSYQKQIQVTLVKR
jgi:hypothetical protein